MLFHDDGAIFIMMVRFVFFGVSCVCLVFSFLSLGLLFALSVCENRDRRRPAVQVFYQYMAAK